MRKSQFNLKSFLNYLNNQKKSPFSSTLRSKHTETTVESFINSLKGKISVSKS